MPNSITNVGFTPTDYTAEMGDIQRRRQMAQALQQQGQEPINPNQTAGGWVVPIHPTQGLAKMLQSYMGARGQTAATEQERALGQKYQSDLAQTLMQAQQAGAGSPGSPQPSEELGGGPAQPPQAPDRQRMAQILMQHPGTAPLGLAQTQRDMQMQSFMGAGQPTGVAGTPQSSAGAGGPPQAQAQPQGFGGPAGGVPMQVWLTADPTGAKYVEQLAKDHKEASAPVIDRGFGIKRWNPATQKYELASNLSDIGAVESTRAAAQAPYQLSTYNTPGSPTLMTHEQAIEQATGRPMPQPGAQPAAQQPAGLPQNVPPQDANAFKYVQENAQRGQPARALGQSQYAGPERRQGLRLQDQGEQKAQVEMGEGLGKRYNAIQDAGFNANQKMQKFDRLGGLLSKIDTGKLTPAGTEISAWAKSAGFPIGDKVDNAQAAKAMANEMALELRNPSGGAGMPGAMSDSDRNYLQSLIANIDKTPGANKLLLEGMQKLAQRDREVAQLSRDYKKKNGSFDDGFYDELGKFSDANPLFKSKPAQTPSGGLSPEETQELQQLRSHFGRR